MRGTRMRGQRRQGPGRGVERAPAALGGVRAACCEPVPAVAAAGRHLPRGLLHQLLCARVWRVCLWEQREHRRRGTCTHYCFPALVIMLLRSIGDSHNMLVELARRGYVPKPIHASVIRCCIYIGFCTQLPPRIRPCLFPRLSKPTRYSNRHTDKYLMICWYLPHLIFLFYLFVYI